MDIKEKEAQLYNQIRPLLEREGLQLFELRIFFRRKNLVLRLLIDYPEGGITLSECSRVNILVSSYLDRNPVFEKSFILEVSSPGVDRELSTLQDFLRIKGKKIRFFSAEDKQIKGVVKGIDREKESIFIEILGNIQEFPLKKLKKARQIIEV